MEQNTNAKISELEKKKELMEVQAAFKNSSIENMHSEYENLKNMYDNIQAELKEIKPLLAAK